MRVFITGDTHGDFERLFEWNNKTGLLNDKENLLIILGDSGFNYQVRENKDKASVDDYRRYRTTLSNWINKNRYINNIKCVTLCIHGNHEARPDTIVGYETGTFAGGRIFYEEDFPTLMFADDGQIYRLNGRDYLVIGGAYSVDKKYRLDNGYRWFDDEQPSDYIKSAVEFVIEHRNNKIDVVLSHTCPLKWEPTELFLPNIDQSTVDKSTESWLDEIENKLDYKRWYFGHYHGNKHIKEGVEMLFDDIIEVVDFERE